MYVCKNDYKNMIKIGVFGITDETIALAGRIKKEKEFALTGIHFSPSAGSSFPQDPGFLATDPEEMLMRSDLVVFSDPYPADLLFLRAAIRMSRPLFFPSTAHLSPQALLEIQALAQEGDVPVYCYNPLRDHPLFRTALEKAGHPLFTEIIRHWRAGPGGERDLTASLIHSVETTLHMNPARPRRPAVGAYFRPDNAAAMVHIQAEFNNGMTALIRHELTGNRNALLCRITGGNGTVTADLENNILRSRGPSSAVRKTLKGKRINPLFPCFRNFALRTGTRPFSLLEERIHATRLTGYILEKIHSKTISHLPAENNW